MALTFTLLFIFHAGVCLFTGLLEGKSLTLVKMARNTLSKTIVIRALQERREIKFNSEHNKDSWGFIVTEPNKVRGWKISKKRHQR